MCITGKSENVKRNVPFYEESSFIGHEFSGICNGRRIMGLVENRGLSLQREIDSYFTWDVPPEWSLQDAATIPVAYAIVSIIKSY